MVVVAPELPLSNTREMFISVLTVTGQVIKVECQPGGTILQVKEKLSDQLTLPPSQQRILYQGKELQDSLVLENAVPPITEDTTLHISLRMRNSTSHSTIPPSSIVPQSSSAHMHQNQQVDVQGIPFNQPYHQEMSDFVDPRIAEESEAREARRLKQLTYFGSLCCLSRTLYVMGPHEREQRIGRDFVKSWPYYVMFLMAPLWFALDIVLMALGWVNFILMGLATLCCTPCGKFQEYSQYTVDHTIATHRNEHPVCLCFNRACGGWAMV